MRIEEALDHTVERLVLAALDVGDGGHKLVANVRLVVCIWRAWGGAFSTTLLDRGRTDRLSLLVRNGEGGGRGHCQQSHENRGGLHVGFLVHRTWLVPRVVAV